MSYPYLKIAMLLIVMLVLTIIPLPQWLLDYRPPWVLLLIIELQLFHRNYFRLWLVVIAGLSLDVILATLLGKHGFGLAASSWFANTKVRRVIFFSSLQKIILVGGLCFSYQLALLIVDVFLQYPINSQLLFKPVIVSIVIWPWFTTAIDYFLKRSKKPSLVC